jgi:type II secretion system protein H
MRPISFAAATPPPSSGRTDGFSLVEMLVVLAILALAAGLGVPAIRSLVPSQRLSAATEAVAGEIALLRTEALRTGRVTRLVFDPEANRFLSSRPGAPGLAMAGVRTRVETPTTSRTESGEIRFLPDGGSTGLRITLTGPGGARVLTVGRATGAVRRAEVTP